MSEKMLMVSLSGIQSYISQARKTADLFIGSAFVQKKLEWIESQIRDKMEKDSQKFSDYHLLFDDIDWDNSPNFFLASFSWNGGEINEEIEEDIKNSLQDAYSKSDGKNKIFPDVELPVFLVITNKTKDYKESYKNLVRKLEAYKNDRLRGLLFEQKNEIFNFKLYKLEEIKNSNSNCSLCGQRTAKYRDKFIDSAKKEYLCALCAQKRIEVNIKELQNKENKNTDSNQKEQEQKKFPSTSEIAEKGRNGKLETSYYALIRLDIDNMGVTIADKKGNISSEELLAYQKNLVNQIGKFTGEINAIIEEKAEKCNMQLMIYSGGDDFLFFCPLPFIFEVLNRIAEKFEKIFHTSNGNEKNSSNELTYSQSILIAHELTPLRRVVRTSAAQLEKVKSAYQKKGKGGTIFTLMYRSSGERSFLIEKKEKQKTMIQLEQLLGLFHENKISSSLMMALEEELYMFGEEMSFSMSNRLVPVIKNEIIRIAKRKSQRGTDVDAVENLFHIFILKEQENIKLAFTSYLDMLHILDKWARCIKEIKE